jgi:hypothetical protein
MLMIKGFTFFVDSRGGAGGVLWSNKTIGGCSIFILPTYHIQIPTSLPVLN